MSFRVSPYSYPFTQFWVLGFYFTVLRFSLKRDECRIGRDRTRILEQHMCSELPRKRLPQLPHQAYPNEKSSRYVVRVVFTLAVWVFSGRCFHNDVHTCGPEDTWHERLRGIRGLTGIKLWLFRRLCVLGVFSVIPYVSSKELMMLVKVFVHLSKISTNEGMRLPWQESNQKSRNCRRVL